MTSLGAVAGLGLVYWLVLPTDFTLIPLYVMYLSCAAMMWPDREVSGTAIRMAGRLLAITFFCIFAAVSRPQEYFGASGVWGHLLLITIAGIVFAVLLNASRVLAQSRLLTAPAAPD